MRAARLLWLIPLLIAALCTAVIWRMTVMPGTSARGPFPALDAEQLRIETRLRGHIAAIAESEHNAANFSALEASARYIESTLETLGYTPRLQPIVTPIWSVRNIEVEIPGSAAEREIVVIGAHYDSAPGAPGANDNGSGVAALLELARLLHGARPDRTLRLVFFVNEEPPFFKTEQMGSMAYAQRAHERGEEITAMLCLETIGYFSDQPGSQHYPFPLSLRYPDTGNFLAFVANPASRPLLREAVSAFRKTASIPSEGLAAPVALTGVDWSDHASFWLQGYPAVMVTDTAPYRYPYYHTAQDTPDKVDYGRLARVTTGLASVISALTSTASPAVH